MAIANINNGDFKAENADSAKDVENRLLDAAEKLFCEKGFGAASVRDLTNEANCNVAAVNYHFGSKEQLYKAMFLRHLKWVLGFYKQNIQQVMNSENPTVEKLIRTLAGNIFSQSQTEHSKIPMLKLIIRESLNPQFKKEVMALEIVKEFFTEIQKALMKLQPQLTPEKAMLCVFSLDGMILHPLLFGDFYSMFIENTTPDKLINHIVQFASDAIRQVANV